jgi:hypothetical protein
MPKIPMKWAEIDEMSGGGFSDIEPGMYELVITDCVANEKDEYFEISWDVASGDSKGNYESSQYPPTARIYWREKALGFLKHRLHVLADWNPGFKSTVAFETDQWSDFKGKRFGAVVRRRLYTAGPRSKNPGADRTSMEIAQWLNPEDFKAKNFNPNLLNDNDQREKPTAQQTAMPTVATVTETYAADDMYDEDIPF